jgi:hypothetical protein
MALLTLQQVPCNPVLHLGRQGSDVFKNCVDRLSIALARCFDEHRMPTGPLG